MDAPIWKTAPRGRIHQIKVAQKSKITKISQTPSFAVLDIEPRSYSSGIDQETKMQEAFGSNAYKQPPTKSFFHFVVEALKDFTILILLACAVLSLGFGIKQHGLKEGWYDSGSITPAVLIVIAFSAISNFKQNRQFEKLSTVSNNIQVDAVRNGRRRQISIFEVLVGDVVCLKIDDQVPADGKNPFLVSGTKVADGYAKMLVTSVGMNTTWGEMMSTISRDSNETKPLQARLNKLTSSIGKVGFTGSLPEDENGNPEFNGSKTKVDDVLNAVIGIIADAVTIVVVIPEGLPLAVTLTLAYSMKRMMADRAMQLVQNLSYTGSPTEKSILSWAATDLKMDMEAMKQS
ncbi:hypothetical protein RJ641_003991 [Dillenia turbinata]|uniref:Cation-transporting P-type ATPase N-terminal domain-containing protein n=1 Tax=Dillenia turbinata TaxID=194707 RepID=A0AAN8Z9P2_9MAGN